MEGNNWEFTSRIDMLDNYTIHAPILIDSNDDFVTLGCEGNGLITSPYIIDGLNITQTGMNAAIKIQYTTAYFVVNCCLILSEYIGIHLDHVGNGTGFVINNTCISSTGDGGGIGLSSSSGCSIISNECSNFMQGIHFNHGSNNIVFGNLINSNNYQGINIRYSDSNIITFNTIQDSEQHGLVFVGTASSNHVSHNIFINNSKVEYYTIDGERTGTISSQGYDEGSNNKWYDDTVQEGNRWSDYDGRGIYTIDGPANSEDLYPIEITSNESDTLIVFNIPLTIICVGLLITLMKRRRK
jgi:parallel beta-helix repeat protein